MDAVLSGSVVHADTAGGSVRDDVPDAGLLVTGDGVEDVPHEVSVDIVLLVEVTGTIADGCGVA
jgi:hypothetical protein